MFNPRARRSKSRSSMGRKGILAAALVATCDLQISTSPLEARRTGLSQICLPTFQSQPDDDSTNDVDAHALTVPAQAPAPPW